MECSASQPRQGHDELADANKIPEFVDVMTSYCDLGIVGSKPVVYIEMVMWMVKQNMVMRSGR